MIDRSTYLCANKAGKDQIICVSFLGSILEIDFLRSIRVLRTFSKLGFVIMGAFVPLLEFFEYGSN